MTQLMKASHNWATRPSDQRFVSLRDLNDFVQHQRAIANEKVVSSHKLRFEPTSDAMNSELQIIGPNGNPVAPTHWSFGQLATLADAPAAYLRTLPAPLVADALNYGIRHRNQARDVGVLLSREPGEDPVMRAATGPRYGRIWNAEVTQALVEKFDGTDWKVPGIFGKPLSEVTKGNTTLYASDRDMFVFLADEENRIEIPNRRNGLPGALARGFFIWNSEVGDATLGIALFLFDYACENRIVWGATQVQELRIRHTAAAPDRYIEEMYPMLLEYSNSATAGVREAVASAQAKRIEKVDDFLAKRFGKKVVVDMQIQHIEEEGRPVETLWDAVTAATAYARTIPFAGARVEIEREAGKMMKLAA